MMHRWACPDIGVVLHHDRPGFSAVMQVTRVDGRDTTVVRHGSSEPQWAKASRPADARIARRTGRDGTALRAVASYDFAAESSDSRGLAAAR